MALFKSNSTLVAFDYKNLNNFYFLNYIQSANYEIKSNRISAKHIGDSKQIQDQIIYPEISLNLNYLQRADFLNEFLFGIEFNADLIENDNFLKNIINDYYTNNIFILNSENLNFDLKNLSYDDSMYVTSFGNVYLNSYATSYKVGQIPSVSVSFLADDMRVSKIQKSNNIYTFLNWDGLQKTLDNAKLNEIKNETYSIYELNYLNNIKLNANELASNSKTPSIILDTFSNGVIRSIDIDIPLNRNKFYFFNKTNKQASRKIILPITGTLNISGYFTQFNLEELKNFFNSSIPFDLQFILNTSNEEMSRIKIEKIIVESFSYSVSINSMIEYSINCSFQINNEYGLKIQRFLNPLEAKGFISSDSFFLQTSDAFILDFLII